MTQAGPSPTQTGADEPALTVADMPSAGLKRWYPHRKGEIVRAVREGLITVEEACNRYTLSVEEFFDWQRLFDAHGVKGLRSTQLQQYRHRVRQVLPRGDGARRQAERDRWLRQRAG